MWPHGARPCGPSPELPVAHSIGLLRARKRRALKKPVVQHMEEGAGQGERGDRPKALPSTPVQAGPYEVPDAEEHVSNCPMLWKARRRLVLLLLERLPAVPVKRVAVPSSATARAPAGEREDALGIGWYQPQEVAEQPVDAGLDHHPREHGRDRGGGGWMGIGQPELAKGPHAHLDPEPDEEEQEGEPRRRAGARRGRWGGLPRRQRNRRGSTESSGPLPRHR